jgi:hypothetical protein
VSGEVVSVTETCSLILYYQVIRNNLKAEAKEQCKPWFKAFGECAAKEGIMVAFRCRDKNTERKF